MSKKTFKLNLAIVRALALTLFSLTISLSLPAQAAQHALAVDYLQGEGDVQGIKLAYQHNVGWLEALHPDLSLALEASVNGWRYGPANQHDSNFVLALSPVLRYPLGQAFDLRLVSVCLCWMTLYLLAKMSVLTISLKTGWA